MPLALRPLGNRREHWRTRARRTRRELAAVLGALRRFAPPALPVTIGLERVGWNRLDPDGLVGACKTAIDAVARWLGVDDRDPRVHWHLSQSTTRERRRKRSGRGHEAAASLRIVARPWHPGDGDDALRVKSTLSAGDLALGTPIATPNDPEAGP